MLDTLGRLETGNGKQESLKKVERLETPNISRPPEGKEHQVYH